MTPHISDETREPRRIRIAPVERFSTEEPPVSPLPDFETRMAEQRHAWMRQDRQRYLPPDLRKGGVNEGERDTHWLVFAWTGRCWKLVAERPIKRGRRKPMTMNRLFANVRQQIGLKKDVAVKLISIRDHAQQLAAIGESWFRLPPVRLPSLRPE